MTKYELSVIAPCYNEEENIEQLVKRTRAEFEKHNIKGQLILVNDGSADKTGEIISSYVSKYDFIKFVDHKKNLGMEEGWKSGLVASEGIYSCFIDADLQYLPEEINKLFYEIKTGNCDIAQGVRSSIGRIKDSRYGLSKGLNFMLNILFGMKSKDNKSGFVMARTEILSDVMSHKFKYYYYQTFITVSAKSKNYRINEIETLFVSRFFGESFINAFPNRLIYRTIVDLLKGFIEFRVLSNNRIGSVASIQDKYSSQNKRISSTSLKEKFIKFIYFNSFFIHKWKITKKTKIFYKQLVNIQWLEKDNIQDLQNEKLKRLINHAYVNVPYYKKIMRENNIFPEDINSPEDLIKLPTLSKKNVKENLYFDLFADNHKKSDMLKISTSGSTGEPFVTYSDKTQLEMRWATTLRSLEWAGWSFGKRQMRFWHQTIGMNKSQVIREKVDSFLSSRTFISAYEMSDDSVKELLEKIKEEKPDFIDGYAESFNYIASYIQRNEIKDVKVPSVMSSAQTLTDETRKLIEDSFGAKVFDKYGSREFSGIAYQCEEGDGYHIMSESYIVEILKDGRTAKSGELGEVVITDLNNFSLPLIRYRIGDLAVAKDGNHKCKCGRNLPMIDKIDGRVKSVIKFSDDSWFPSSFFLHLLKDYYYAIKKFQIIQYQIDALEIKIVRFSGYHNVENEIKENLYKFIPNNVIINFTYHDEIAMTKTGKHLSVINKQEFDFQEIDNN